MVLQHSRDSVPDGFIANGPAPADDPITIRLALTSSNMTGLEQKLLSISDPTSTEYGQWLTKEEVKAFVQPSAQTVAAVSAWATANSITTTTISPNEEWVAITVPISQANELLDAEFTVFTHTSSNRQIVRTLSFSFPSELVGHVNTAHPTTTFTIPGIDPNSQLHWTSIGDAKINPDCNSTITPACLEDLYGIPTTPATQKSNKLQVNGYDGEFAQVADLQSFISQFQPLESPSTTFALETIDGGENTQGAADAGTEANLDIQYTVGIALGVPITFFSNGNEDFPTAVLDTATDNEFQFTPSLAVQICNEYMALGARGITVINSSGDGGVRGHHDTISQCPNNTFIPTFPSTCPFVTGVGATIGIEPERAINFTGGGFSNVFSRPSFQDAAVKEFLSTLPPKFPGIFNSNGRGYPDVAMQGWNFEVVNAGEVGLVGGTSASAPSFASVVALLNDRLVAAGKPVLGFLNPFLYSTAGSNAFTSITIGKNVGFTCPSNATAFTAIEGWDPLTGHGTPVFSKLLAAVGHFYMYVELRKYRHNFIGSRFPRNHWPQAGGQEAFSDCVTSEDMLELE
ncbi:family S53 protease-like protein [Rhodocollybia butyracea]|uniref:Family S53 protease-like protein n=1 Tax=Rhodocollybia butyracea TaxID=206335 RepID=A0A9P5TZ08_9AGAR|nr:family S53 protease-like protein [Rhodocollybia butyracea]